MSSLGGNTMTEINEYIANAIWAQPGEMFEGCMTDLVATIPELAGTPERSINNALAYQRKRCRTGKAQFQIPSQGGARRKNKQWMVVDELGHPLNPSHAVAAVRGQVQMVKQVETMMSNTVDTLRQLAVQLAGSSPLAARSMQVEADSTERSLQHISITRAGLEQSDERLAAP